MSIDDSFFEMIDELDNEGENSEKDEVYWIVHKMPEFPGGKVTFNKLLKKNIQIPKKELNKASRNTILYNLIIGKTGKIIEVKILNGASDFIDKELERVALLSPTWKPGEFEGKKVKVKLSYFYSIK